MLITKRVTDKCLNISVDDILRDLAHLLVEDGLRASREFSEDVSFRASSDEETKMARKGILGNFLRKGT